MTTPGAGFAVRVAELERLAAALPTVADAMRPPIALLTEHTPTPRPMQVAAAPGTARASRSSPASGLCAMFPVSVHG